jgi:hypothetical protein
MTRTGSLRVVPRKVPVTSTGAEITALPRSRGPGRAAVRFGGGGAPDPVATTTFVSSVLASVTYPCPVMSPTRSVPVSGSAGKLAYTVGSV